MSAQSYEAITLWLANPADGPSASNQRPQPVDAANSFRYPTDGGISTLSQGKASPGVTIQGLLYTPDLPAKSPCVNASSQIFPKNVTRESNEPPDYQLVALAPWISPECTLAYLAAADTVRTYAFMFYVPDNSTSAPADGDSNNWTLGDNGAWKKNYDYPVYAISGNAGKVIMGESGIYSGNVSTLGDYYTSMYDSDDYIRLLVQIDTEGTGTSLPSLWIFLLIVLGILLAVIGCSAGVMHVIQRRRIASLRRRVQAGEVDLEALGIKRLTVPQAVLDKMPLYPYGSNQRDQMQSAESARIAAGKSEADTTNPSSPTTLTTPPPALNRSTSYHPTAQDQPTCPICLDDFEHTTPSTPGSTVRELPCHHIFHPECVDAFLTENSSLCPMCKKTALPQGYCPEKITAGMVRSERLLRRRREQGLAMPERLQIPNEEHLSEVNGESLASRFRTRTFSGLSHLRGAAGRRVSSMPVETEMGPIAHPPPARSNTDNQLGSAARPQPPSSQSRRQWAQQRAVAMLGRQAPLDPDADEAQRLPRWRKALRGVFPT